MAKASVTTQSGAIQIPFLFGCTALQMDLIVSRQAFCIHVHCYLSGSFEIRRKVANFIRFVFLQPALLAKAASRYDGCFQVDLFGFLGFSPPFVRPAVQVTLLLFFLTFKKRFQTCRINNVISTRFFLKKGTYFREPREDTVNGISGLLNTFFNCSQSKLDLSL